MPKSVQRCSTNMSHSSNVPSSSSSSSRSRAVSLPLACCEAMRFSPPPRRAAARLFSSCSRMSCMWVSVLFLSRRTGSGVHVLVSFEQLPRGRRGGQLALLHLFHERRQQAPHLRVVPEGVLQARVDALPHPR